MILLILIPAQIMAGHDPFGPPPKKDEHQTTVKKVVLDEAFKNAKPLETRDYQDGPTIQSLNESLPQEYLIGPGDVIDIQVWDLPELSGEHTIGPRGNISLPLVGMLNLSGLSQATAMERVNKGFSEFYKNPFVNLQIKEFNNNYVYVLGRVSQPGRIPFRGQGTLLEALSLAGSVPDPATELVECAVIRGRDQIIWIDLRELLVRGNTSLNLSLTNGDIVFIPELSEANFFVMGEVANPGAYRLRSGSNFMDALMGAGGPTEDGVLREVALIRKIDGTAHILKINIHDIREGRFTHPLPMQAGDVIYVQRKGLANFEYVMRQVNPFTSLLLVSTALGN